MKTPPIRVARGVTLVELMIVLAILGILVGFVVPNYGAMMAERAVAAETRRIISVLKLARSEARARGATVTVSRAAGSDWSGLIDVYESTTIAGNAAYVEPTTTATTTTTATPATTASVDDLIKRREPSGRTVTVKDDATNNGQYISFNMRGWLSTGETSAILIAVCSPGIDVSRGKYIEINRVGKIRERAIGTGAGGCL